MRFLTRRIEDQRGWIGDRMPRYFGNASLVCLLGLLTLAVAVPAVSAAQDMTGTWVLAVTLDVGSGDATLVLTQEGNAISGTYTGALGEELPVTGEVTEEGIRISFDSEAGEISYSGTLEEGVFKGTCEYGQLGSGTFEGEKQGTAAYP